MIYDSKVKSNKSSNWQQRNINWRTKPERWRESRSHNQSTTIKSKTRQPSARTLDIERLFNEHCNAKSISLDQLAQEGAGAAALKDLIKGLEQYTNAEISNSLRRTRRRIKEDKENNGRHATMNQSDYSSTAAGDDDDNDYSTAMPDAPATATPRKIIRARRPNYTGTPINRSKTGVGLRGAATDVKCHQYDDNWELDPLNDDDIKTAAEMIAAANVPSHVEEIAESEEKLRAAALNAGTTNAKMKLFWSRHPPQQWSWMMNLGSMKHFLVLVATCVLFVVVNNIFGTKNETSEKEAAHLSYKSWSYNYLNKMKRSLILKLSCPIILKGEHRLINRSWFNERVIVTMNM